ALGRPRRDRSEGDGTTSGVGQAPRGRRKNARCGEGEGGRRGRFGHEGVGHHGRVGQLPRDPRASPAREAAATDGKDGAPAGTSRERRGETRSFHGADGPQSGPENYDSASQRRVTRKGGASSWRSLRRNILCCRRGFLVQCPDRNLSVQEKKNAASIPCFVAIVLRVRSCVCRSRVRSFPSVKLLRKAVVIFSRRLFSIFPFGCNRLPPSLRTCVLHTAMLRFSRCRGLRDPGPLNKGDQLGYRSLL
ncbi:unnamed protein product, partial [Ectocarpus sp. 6 AP-2014]